MADRFPARILISGLLIGSLVLGACGPAGPGGGRGADTDIVLSQPESELRRQSQAMQRTIVEAIALGGLAGLATGLVVRNLSEDADEGTVGRFFRMGLVAGAVSGTYVAFLQRNFASQEARLTRIRDDLAANNAETEAILRSMRVVLASQTEELNRARAAVAAGRADQAALDQELREAEANLEQMRGAISGAERRHADFARARRNNTGGNTAEVDRELARLERQIAEMRTVAERLASQL